MELCDSGSFHGRHGEEIEWGVNDVLKVGYLISNGIIAAGIGRLVPATPHRPSPEEGKEEGKRRNRLMVIQE